MDSRLFARLLFSAAFATTASAQAEPTPQPPPTPQVGFRLTGWAAIPSTYRTPGPVCGQSSKPANGVSPPYSAQVIPGFSGFIPSPTPGTSPTFIGMPDNGFGAQANSADYVLGFYLVTPEFKTAGDGAATPGGVNIGTFVPFNDENGLLTNGVGVDQRAVYTRSHYYPPPAEQIQVDPSIRSRKLLTGADFDIESIARLDDGTFWVGDEFGPFLLHFSAGGTLIDEPVPHPVLRSPQNPMKDRPNLAASRGFEAMCRNGDGSKLYLTSEASIDSEPDKRMLTIYQFDTATRRYDEATFRYRKDGDEINNTILVGDMTCVGGSKYIVIERDDLQGPAAKVKRLYLIDLTKTDAGGVLGKVLLADLLHIPDPARIGGKTEGLPDGTFGFPLQSVESVTLTDPSTLVVALDSNYPDGNGRHPGKPDDTEVIRLAFDKPIAEVEVP